MRALLAFLMALAFSGCAQFTARQQADMQHSLRYRQRCSDELARSKGLYVHPDNLNLAFGPHGTYTCESAVYGHGEPYVVVSGRDSDLIATRH